MNNLRLSILVLLLGLAIFSCKSITDSSSDEVATRSTTQDLDRVPKKIITKSIMSDTTAIINEKWPEAITTASGLKYVVTQEGEGDAKPQKGSTITAHYTGMLLDGSKFDSSVDRNEPFVTAIGVGQVIAGWDEAFVSMKKGEKRTLIIPPELGYGAGGYPPIIPANATLVFDVELLSF